MQLKRKPTAWVFFAAVVAWQTVVQPIWNLNVEHLAQARKLDTALDNGGRIMSWFREIASYLPNSFSLGFVVGGLIFAYWDVISSAFNRHILRRPEATSIESSKEIKAWLGDVTVSIDREDPSLARIFMRIINWGDIPFKIAAISGNIVMSHDSGSIGRTNTVLPSVTMGDPSTWNELVEPGYLLHLDMHQKLPKSISVLLPDLLAWSIRPNLHLVDFKIILSSPSAPDKPLKLPDGLRITAGDWNVRTAQTTNMFKSDDERLKFINTMNSVINKFGKSMG